MLFTNTSSRHPASPPRPLPDPATRAESLPDREGSAGGGPGHLEYSQTPPSPLRPRRAGDAEYSVSTASLTGGRNRVIAAHEVGRREGGERGEERALIVHTDKWPTPTPGLSERVT